MLGRFGPTQECGQCFHAYADHYETFGGEPGCSHDYGYDEGCGCRGFTLIEPPRCRATGDGNFLAEIWSQTMIENVASFRSLLDTLDYETALEQFGDTIIIPKIGYVATTTESDPSEN